MKLQRIYDRVMDIMKDNPEARDNDGLLIAMVDMDMNPNIRDMDYCRVMAHRTQLGLATCESIRRARQKAQEQFPSLAGDRRVQKMREKQIAEYEEFARGVTR